MFPLSFTLSPKAVLDYIGIEADNELVELMTIFTMRLTQSPKKALYLKEALKRALRQEGRDPSGRWDEREKPSRR